ncbi:OPT superfamily oligopeptide transporter [Venturia nashicola]|uniref:OPT superfamily oligopeptide transporter n=1 Tax=Venturia nashicola TaxID=86259 RepID=A0A4Z1NIQ1_9PEZI|nr:OPT superfamily oligopeptide transporter [Venturia nashicola]
MTSYQSSSSYLTAVEEIAMQDMQSEQTWEGVEKKNAGRWNIEESESTLPSYRNPLDEHGSAQFDAPAETAKDLATEVIHAEDDPGLNPWTFRVWFLGIGLSTFGGSLATIYYFKPQTVSVSTIFLGVISYVLGEAMSILIPTKGVIGRFLNPHPFNSKEHAAIVVMSAAAANAPLAIEVLAVQRLYYGKTPSAVIGIFLIFASQCLGYGVAGLLRRTLVYPTKMLYPSNLPIVSLIETLHGEKSEVKKKLRVFYIGFSALFIWEFFPEYVMPILTGVSAFCLTNRKSMVFTNIFGGSNGNEGLGLLSICFDWQYIGSSAMWLPLQTLCNNLVGYFLCIAVFTGVYYGNIWNARKFPFLSQLLFTEASNGTHYVQFNQSAILNSKMEVEDSLIGAQGLPYFTATFASYILSTNLAITATFSHMLLWHYNDIKSAWAFASVANLKHMFSPRSWNWKFWKHSTLKWGGEEDKEDDPHYRLMTAYQDAPNWWYGMVLVLSIVIGLLMLYTVESTLPWWGFLVACSLSSICILFFGAQTAITGFGFNVQPVIQMLGGYLHPGRPMANMYFVLFGYNSVAQGHLLLKDLKFAQYTHLSPRCTFAMQMSGTIIGSIFSYLMMSTITTSQRETLLSIEGTNIWSGQTIQTFNSQAIAWGGLASKLFSVGGRYQWVTLAFLIGFVIPLPFYLAHKKWSKAGYDYWNFAIITYYIGFLCVGINSSILSFFAIGFFTQFYLRRYKADWFIKYNYLLSAAMDGGTQVLVFILTFAVFGGGGKEVKFPPYWGNNFQKGNYDYCQRNPAK